MPETLDEKSVPLSLIMGESDDKPLIIHPDTRIAKHLIKMDNRVDSATEPGVAADGNVGCTPCLLIDDRWPDNLCPRVYANAKFTDTPDTPMVT